MNQKNIKRIKESLYRLEICPRRDVHVKKIKSKSISEFSESGNLIAFYKFTFAFGRLFKSKKIYDDHGYEIENHPNIEGDLIQKYTLKYDGNNNLVERNNYSSDGTLCKKEIFIYNDEGKKIESLYFDGFRGREMKNIFNYDEKKYKEELKHNPLIDSLITRTCYKYDDRGNLTEVWVYDRYGKLSDRNIAKYDLNGNMIENTEYFGDAEETNHFTYVYDEKGNRISGSVREKGENDRTWYNVYTQFDEYGNWIEMTEFENEVPSEFYLRKIEYYQ